ncbi:MerR family transcriptional regulator [Nocardia sp. CDC159]|uniref:MerR family transcriptional regulator n=1 Tax=Nocardia pulmonis TaxID=2951408 RepID=A0A9X2E955_9NOCA|nr:MULTISPECIES: MerR family transcriptional regulator [Nocardia]MCM6776594.1 MerR family transcriptional regulator [Nocardia pulmonis]MCM6789018.1 MerR family transcriptional regulator [Nocardia sp. CDC159]
MLKSTSRHALPIGPRRRCTDLTPATLRWWERQGVIPPPRRRGGRRCYDEADLRRIGLAYLCCVTGRMSLSSAAIVTTGTARIDQWQRSVTEQIDRLDEQIAQRQAARAYLLHLLCCTDDDMAQCPHLDAELIAHTPLGRDEIAPRGDEIDGRNCASCGNPLTTSARGRPRSYCSQTCRQRAYRHRRSASVAPSDREQPRRTDREASPDAADRLEPSPSRW